MFLNPSNLEGLSTLEVSGNAFTGCVPPVLRKVSSNDLGKLSIKDCATPTPTPTATATATTTATATVTPTTTATPTPTATATPATYTLTLAAGAGGSLSADPAGPGYVAGTAVTVTATAQAGYRLSAWGGDCAATAARSASCALTLDGDRTVSASFAALGPPAAPVLLAVTTGNAGEVLLEWTPGGDAAGVTKWQYRLRLQREEFKPWGAWTDVPGSAAATRSYLVSGLNPGGVRHAHHWQLRAVAGTLAGSPSAAVEGSPAFIGAGGIPSLLPDNVIEGGRAWLLAGEVVIDVPAGTRLRYGGGGYVNGVIYVSIEDAASGWWQEINATTLTPAGRGQDAVAGVAAAAQAGGEARDVEAILDAIVESLRRVGQGK